MKRSSADIIRLIALVLTHQDTKKSPVLMNGSIIRGNVATQNKPAALDAEKTYFFLSATIGDGLFFAGWAIFMQFTVWVQRRR